MPHHTRVIITDLDGTLLNNNHSISDFTKQVFQELYLKDYLFIVATGRHHLDALPLVEKLGVPLYLVTSNGARIHSPNKQLMYAKNMDPQKVASILSLHFDPEVTMVMFKEDYWQTNQVNEKLNSFQKVVTYHPQIVDFKSITDFEAIKIFFSHDDHQKLQKIQQQILELHPNEFNHAFSLPICLEFMDKTVDKSHAIAQILAKEGYTFYETISFGDGFNDEKMLLASHKACIMGNAPLSLKEKLAHLEVIQTNHQDGVATYLNQYFLV